MHRIAVIPGDGIGKEVVPEGIRVLEAAGRRFGLEFHWDELPWSCEYYLAEGRMMPADGLDRIRHHDAIFLGAVGFPGVPDHVSLWGLLIPIRRGFQQYANVRPVRLMPGIPCPLAGRKPGDIDMVVVRENNEGEYSSIGGRMYEGTEFEFATQQSTFTRRGVDRILRYAFETAMSRPKKHLTSATKSNGISVTMPFWDERFREMAKSYPDIRTDQYHVDILSDLGPGCTGTIAIAPSANLNPEREFPSMFEPVHGSAPDIYGKGIANPVGQIWAGALMLDHLGHAEAARGVMAAIEKVLAEGPRTPDMGGTARTEDVGKAIADAV